MKWKPIETAPNDEAILVRHDDGEVEIVSEDDNTYEWKAYDGKNQNVSGITKPTHWMAVSELPSI